jgi:zinc/manganese transport system permease protein
MRRALVAILCLASSGGVIGIFLIMRRMSLLGDAMSHAVLPGAALGYVFGGLSLPLMSLGGFIAGLLVALAAGLATRFSVIKEDANFAAFYLISLALGVLIISVGGNKLDLLHILFGSVLGVDDAALWLIGGIASFSLLLLALFYRLLLMEMIDPLFLQAIQAPSQWAYLLFLGLVVLNLVAGFHSLGTLMSVGLMMLPAIIAKLWTRHLGMMFITSMAVAAGSGYAGLLLSFYFELPSGPAIILLLGILYLLSLVFSPFNGVLARFFPLHHYKTHPADDAH